VFREAIIAQWLKKFHDPSKPAKRGE
ncbi:MAG: hypothetical protein ACI8W8_004927, partial [Rhodothermales bacterium]